MFKDTTPTKIDRANFGAGSFVKDGNDFFLVVARGGYVALVSLNTFTLLGDGDNAWVKVTDQNFLTEGEARKLCSIIEGATFSDHELLPAGMKEYQAVPAPERSSGRGCGINKF
jgi:hypothetical protein